jgi:hypothetical protein
LLTFALRIQSLSEIPKKFPLIQLKRRNGGNLDDPLIPI